MGHQLMLLANLVACGAGISAGLLASELSILGSRRLGDNGFWQRLSGFGRLLIAPNLGDRLIAEYLQLWPLLLMYTAKKFATGIMALAPIAITYGCLKLMAGVLDQSAGTAKSQRDFSWSMTSGWEYYFFSAVCLASLMTWLAVKFKR